MINKISRFRLPTNFSTLICFIYAIFFSQISLVSAQPDIEVTQLLFEPIPLPVAGSVGGVVLTSISEAEAEIPVAMPTQGKYSEAELDQMLSDIKLYLVKVGDMEALEGPYSDQLREDLFATGTLYQQTQEHDKALQMFERALAVSRINSGLQSLDQVPIMEAMALSYTSQLKFIAADAMMNAAFNLQEKVYGVASIELVSAQIKLGDWNTQAFMDRSSILVNIPRMNVQSFVADPKNFIPDALDPRETPLYKLYEARVDYLNAIKSLVNVRAFSHPEIMALENKLLTNYFLHTHRENILYEPDFYLTRKKTKTATRLNQNAIELMNSENYDLGKEAHRRRLAYLNANQTRTPADVASAMLEEADWDLLFQRKTDADDKYIIAYQFFTDNPTFLSAAANVIYPAVPVVLPAYLPAPNSRAKLDIATDANVNFFGFIDVSFSINKFGKARKVKMLGKEGEVTRNMEIRLNQYLRNVLFRPRYTNNAVDTSTISLRYYIGV